MAELAFACPKCGKPRRLIGYGVTRELRCGTWDCYPRSESVPADLKLTIKQMAEGMAHESIFNKSDDQRKEQAKARRAGTTVRTFAQSPYLSEGEASILTEAADILERLGTAAEQAKKELKRQEQAEELRQASRRRAAHAVLFPRLDYPGEFSESVPLVLALATTWQNSHNTPDRIDNAIRDALAYAPHHRRTAKDRVGFEINNTWSNILDAVQSTIAYSSEDDPEVMAERFICDVDQALSSPALTERAGELVELIHARLVQERLEQTNPKAGQ